MIELYDYQLEAVERMKNGCILCGGVGSGKSRTSLAYYFIQNGGKLGMGSEDFHPMSRTPLDLYIITTAKKRDSKEWLSELVPFNMTVDEGYYQHKVVVDSWNNIKKYIGVTNSFFIFDEDRVTGRGTWVKAFINISKLNRWIILSATPGDTWMDYVPVFIANGFYRNQTQFNSEHVQFARFDKFPIVTGYFNTRRLTRLRDSILVDMDMKRSTVRNHINITCNYDTTLYRKIFRDRWDIYKDEPVQNAGGLCYTLRKLVNSDESRTKALFDILQEKKKVILFYSYDYELVIIERFLHDIGDYPYAQWNGHKHQEIPDGDEWVYIVQYNAGCEGWNCITTDTIVFYSQTYSYKVLEQACGRIDRVNTKYVNLYYYHLKSTSSIDLAISRALHNKKLFNEGRFVK